MHHSFSIKKLEYKACHIGNDFFVFIMYVVGRNLRKNKQSSMKVGLVVIILAVQKYLHGVALLQPPTRSFRQPQNGGDPGLKKITVASRFKSSLTKSDITST